MPARKHDFTVTEIKAGFMVLAGLVIFALFVMVVTKSLPAGSGATYYCSFENLSGLNKGADVRFGGFKVGKVVEMDLHPDNQTLIRATLLVDEAVPVNDESFAYISQVTLTSAPHVELDTGGETAPRLSPGSEIPTQPGGLFGSIGKIAGTVEALVKDVRALIGVEKYRTAEEAAPAEGETAAETGETAPAEDEAPAGEPAQAPAEELHTVADIIKDLERVLGEGEGFAEDIRGLLDDHKTDIDEIVDKVKEVEDAAHELVTQINDVVSDSRAPIESALTEAEAIATKAGQVADNILELSERLDTFADALQVTLDNAAALSGDAQGMLEVNRPVIDDILQDLRESVRYFKTFARTLQEQPEAILRGKEGEGRKGQQ